MEELIRILEEIRDQKDVAGNTAYKIGDALLRLSAYLTQATELVSSLADKIGADAESTYLLKSSAAGERRLCLTEDGEAKLRLISSSGAEFNEEQTLLNKKNFMAQLTSFQASELTAETDGTWATPPIQLLVGNAQVQLTTAEDTVVTVARSNAPTKPFSPVTGWSETATPTNNVFNIYGGVAGIYVKIKFSVKPSAISVLS